VKAICTMSADLASIELLAGTAALDLAGAQYVAAVEEEPQATDAQTLYDMTVDPRDLQHVLQTDDHGVDLLNGSVDAQNGTVGWFADEL
jgi:hypothetical protein